jgi:hypothetical protein
MKHALHWPMFFLTCLLITDGLQHCISQGLHATVAWNKLRNVRINTQVWHVRCLCLIACKTARMMRKSNPNKILCLSFSSTVSFLIILLSRHPRVAFEVRAATDLSIYVKFLHYSPILPKTRICPQTADRPCNIEFNVWLLNQLRVVYVTVVN